MDTTSEQVNLLEIPEGQRDEARFEIESQSTGILSVANTEHSEPYLLGSGTLVSYKGHYGVLTAQHLTSSKAYKMSDNFSFAAKRGQHRFTIPRYETAVIVIGQSKELGEGPDLSFIEIFSEKLGVLRANKTFCDLQRYSQKFLNGELSQKGIWAFSGCPYEFSKGVLSTKEADPHFFRVKAFAHETYFTFLDEVSKEDQYDYLSLGVDYKEPCNPPRSFKGVSGGGVWKIPLTVTAEGSYILERPIFFGVAFRESDIIEGSKSIKAHGPRSIYEVAIAKLDSEFGQ